MSTETLYLLLPEIVLVLLATAIYLGGAFLPGRAGWSVLAAAGLILASVFLYQQNVRSTKPTVVSEATAVANLPASTAAADATPKVPPSRSTLVIDRFSTTLRGSVLFVGLVFVMLSSRASRWGESSEYIASLVLIIAGLMLVALAGDLVLMFVALELISIPTYVLLYLGRQAGVLESGTKYFFLSVLSSALLLYGFSFLYGAAGSTDLQTIRERLAAAVTEPSGVAALAPLALVLIVAGLGFRITAVPFHFYAPDVYQGTSNPNAGLLAVIPKIAGLVALVRIVFVAMPGLEQLGWQISLALAMVTMTLGNLLALWQTNLRRMFAYSSVAHAGYLLIGVAVGFAVAGGAVDPRAFDGIGAMLFYLLVYAAATAGTFAALSYLSSKSRSTSSVDELAGLSQSFPRMAAAIAVFMFSLTGLPPLAGFWGKFTLFTGALGVDAQNPAGSSLWPWFVALAIVGAINAAISAAYYLRIVAVMYFRPALTRPDAQGGLGAAWATAVCAVLVLLIGFNPAPWIDAAQKASQSVRVTNVKLDTAGLNASDDPAVARSAVAR